jgi:hypothetical protein
VDHPAQVTRTGAAEEDMGSRFLGRRASTLTVAILTAPLTSSAWESESNSPAALHTHPVRFLLPDNLGHATTTRHGDRSQSKELCGSERYAAAIAPTRSPASRLAIAVILPPARPSQLVIALAMLRCFRLSTTA